VTETGNAFRRWIRLKQEANAVHRQRTVATGVEAATAVRNIDATTEGSFDPTSLPSIEAITADTDVVAFLQANVPKELTRAALRRAWATDPAIRDFIGVAENQWDFNDPDGIPGFGPLNAAEIGTSNLAILSGGSLEKPPLPAEMSAFVTPDPPGVECSSRRAPNMLAEDSEGRLAESDVSSNDTHRALADEGGEILTEERAASKFRRHGSALPG
jgi:hypothetical protein